MRFAQSGLVVLTAVAFVACGTEPSGGVGAAHDNGADERPLDEDSVLEFLNGPDATEFTLVQEVRLQTRTATSIFAHVRGADRTLGTRDDDLLETMDELDAIPFVGPASIEALKAYVRANYQDADVTVEGVALSSDNAAAMVALSNTATVALLDDDVGLDARAANAIVAARPLADIAALAAVSYVGTTALTRLRDYVIAHPTTLPPVTGPAATILRAEATSSERVVITFSKPLDPATPDASFDVFVGEPDAPLSAGLESIVGAVVTLWTDTQEPGLDYTVELAETVRAADGTLVDPLNGRWVHFDGFTDGATPPGNDCSAYSGGTFDGVSFTGAEECAAVSFLNFARFSEMGALTDTARRVAYDCAPDGSCGFRTSAWERVSQFANFSGVGATSVSGVKSAAAAWSRNGLAWDTVANVWVNRAALVDQPIHFDSVFVEQRLADITSGNFHFVCIRLRDNATAPNYLNACMASGVSDSVGNCAINAGACLDPFVGEQVSLRGTLKHISGSNYRLSIASAGPGAANPAVQ